MPMTPKPAKPTIVKLLVTLNVPVEAAKENMATLISSALNEFLDVLPSPTQADDGSETSGDPRRNITFTIKRHTPPKRFHAKSTVKRAKVVKLARKHKR